MQAAVLHAPRLTGRLHRRQQVSAAQVLAGLGGEQVGAVEDRLCFQVLGYLHCPGVDRSGPPARLRLRRALDEGLLIHPNHVLPDGCGFSPLLTKLLPKLKLSV